MKEFKKINETPAEIILRPFQEFAKVEACGGIILFVCTIGALIWANSQWAESYHHLWEKKFTIGLGHYILSKSLHHWINDGLMTIFFLVVGLEIKREIMVGELASLKKAILPIAAAIGGMVVPAIIYYVINRDSPGLGGWGIPMATDIAFALGVLTILGNRVPSGLKIFLLALAIVDDLGAVLVIALFYTSEVSWNYLGIGAFIYVLLIIFNQLRIRNTFIYYIVGAILWLAFLKSGIHATLAGVLLAITIPTRTRIKRDVFLWGTSYWLKVFESASKEQDCVMANEEQQEAIHGLEHFCDKANSPALLAEHSLHPWVTYIIMPIFALANAGVHIEENFSQSVFSVVSMGIIMGLVLGKPIGITMFSWIAVKSGFADLPKDVSWIQLTGGGCLAGIGFTMSIFIANLAFGEDSILTISKIGIIIASSLAGILGAVILLIFKSSNEKGT